MVERTEMKGGEVRDELLASRAKPRPANEGRFSNKDPLVGADEQILGRAASTAPKRAGFVLGTILAITAAGFAIGGCDKGKGSNDIPDAGWDAGEDTDSSDTDTYLDLCGEAGSAVADNEALLSVGGKSAVFTKAKNTVKALEVSEDIGQAVLEFDEPNGVIMGSGYEVVDNDHATKKVGTDEGTQTVVFCGIEESSSEGVAVRLATDRENGFVHCDPVDSGADSVPVYQDLNGDLQEVLVTNTSSTGEFAEDGDTEDCDPDVTTLNKQYISFQTLDGVPSALGSRNNLLIGSAEALKVHRMVDNLLQAFDVDLLEADAEAGTVKIATENLGVAILQMGHSMVANDELRITLNGFNGEAPDFSYGYDPDETAEIWTTATANPNEVNVNVVSGDTNKTYAVRFSNNKGDDMVDVKVLDPLAISVLGNGSESNLNGVIYSSEVVVGTGGITNIRLKPSD